FAETDPADASNVIAGLFVFDLAGTVPADGVRISGLAGRIALNERVDPVQGGDAERLRDGINFDFNPDGHASFSDYISSLVDQIDNPRMMVGAGGVVASQSLST